MLSFFDDNEKIKEDEIKSSSLLKEKEEKKENEEKEEKEEKENEEMSLNDILTDVNELKKSLNDVNELKKSLNDVLEIVKLLQNKGDSNNGTSSNDN